MAKVRNFAEKVTKFINIKADWRVGIHNIYNAITN